MAVSGAEPQPDCQLCTRLAHYRADLREAEPDWFNAPVPTFGDANARLLIVGLAPGVRGANRTGRPFTGDYAGDLLYVTLAAHDFSRGRYDARVDDGIDLIDCAITNAVRCVPPQNKPTGPEITTCRAFLSATLASFAQLTCIICLGRIAHNSVVAALGAKQKEAPFAHQAHHVIGHVTLIDSYHCSRYNTNTGRLTEEMFTAVFTDARRLLAAKPA